MDKGSRSDLLPAIPKFQSEVIQSVQIYSSRSKMKLQSLLLLTLASTSVYALPEPEAGKSCQQNTQYITLWRVNTGYALHLGLPTDLCTYLSRGPSKDKDKDQTSKSDLSSNFANLRNSLQQEVH